MHLPGADPGRAQRGPAARDRRAARPGTLVDEPGRGTERSVGRRVLRHPGHQRARGEPGQGDRGGQARVHREAQRRARWTARSGWPAPRAQAGITNGVVQDKLFLPGMIKLRRLVRSGFFGRVLSARLEFGYWVFEGDGIAAQRPSWNYRREDGGGIVLDMFPHWQYLLEDLFGPITALYARHTTHVPRRWDESGEPYDVTADDAAYAVLEFESGVFASVNSSWAVRVNRQGTGRAARRRHARQRGRRAAQLRCAAPGVDADAGLESGPARSDRLPRAVDRRPGQRGVRQRLQGRSGSCSCAAAAAGHAVPAGTWPKAPRASSWPSWRCSPRAEGRRVTVPPLEI